MGGELNFPCVLVFLVANSSPLALCFPLRRAGSELLLNDGRPNGELLLATGELQVGRPGEWSDKSGGLSIVNVAPAVYTMGGGRGVGVGILSCSRGSCSALVWALERGRSLGWWWGRATRGWWVGGYGG